MTEAFDYIVVGGGSAGCILAEALSRDPSRSVLLLEAGADKRSLYMTMPAAFAFASRDAGLSWNYDSEPEPHLAGRRIPCPRGKVIGGSSAINAMAFVRGHRRDFDRWADLAGPDWSYAACLPYFRRIETFEGAPNQWRGAEGPMGVRAPRYSNPLYTPFLAACAEAGYPINDDTNGADQEGFGPMDQNIQDGKRCSSARAFLDGARGRRNLTIRARSQATRILFEGRRASGLAYLHDGVARTVTARREIVLSAGATNSPQLLLLSGIGPADALAEHGIAPVVDLQGVGRRLADHVDVSVKQICLKPVSSTPLMSGLRKLGVGLRWLATHDGPGATNHFEVAGYIRTSVEHEQPDIQVVFAPLLASYDGTTFDAPHGYMASIMLLRPRSEGSLRLASSDPLAPPRLRFNYLADADDRVRLREGLRSVRGIFAQRALSAYSGPELLPGSECRTDEQIDHFVATTAKSTHHPCGTCRMGLDDDAVVDPAGRVRGVGSLRVVDASIMPSITSGNINAPVMMLAAKLADSMLHPATAATAATAA